MVVISKIIGAIDLVNEKISRWGSFLVFVLIVTFFYEVVARYAFGRPTQWSFDLTYFLSSAFIILSMAYTWKCNEHVEVDLISSKLPRRITALLNIIFILGLFFLAWINIARVMFAHVLNSWQIKELATIGSMPPIYPYKTWILLGVTMMIFQGVSKILKEFIILIGGGNHEC